jgi:hypothetical protein
VLRGFGFQYMTDGGYDKYDTQAPSSNQRNNEALGYWAADPSDPSVGVRNYDVVIWTTGPAFNVGTILDTTQTFLKQFVFNGGRLLVMGDRIMEDLTDPDTPVDPDFVSGILGAELATVGNPYHANGFLDPDRFVIFKGVGPKRADGDSLHHFAGCDIPRPRMDKIKITNTSPSWSSPVPYMMYSPEGAPDSVAAIYNTVTFSASDTGLVVYAPWSLDAVVDAHEVTCDPPESTPPTAPGGGEDIGLVHVYGQAEFLADVLQLFGCVISTTGTPPVVAAGSYHNELFAPTPNPFNPETTVRFSLASRGHVALEVFDVTGRKVKTLVNEVRDAGPYSVRWDGKNDAGRSVASGLYFARMESQDFVANQKMTLLK